MSNYAGWIVDLAKELGTTVGEEETLDDYFKYVARYEPWKLDSELHDVDPAIARMFMRKYRDTWND